MCFTLWGRNGLPLPLHVPLPLLFPFPSGVLHLRTPYGERSTPTFPLLSIPSGVHHLMGEKGAPLPPHVPRMFQLMFPKWGEKRVPLSPPHNPLPSPIPQVCFTPKPLMGEKGDPHIPPPFLPSPPFSLRCSSTNGSLRPPFPENHKGGHICVRRKGCTLTLHPPSFNVVLGEGVCVNIAEGEETPPLGFPQCELR